MEDIVNLVVPGDADRAVVAAYPDLRHLSYLRDGGWRFLPTEPGRNQIDGFRQWADGWRDAIRIKDSGDALGLRLASDHAITWEYAGALAEVVQELDVTAQRLRDVAAGVRQFEPHLS